MQMAFPGITWANDSRQPAFVIVTGVLVGLSMCAVCLRLYCRISYIKRLGQDDYFIIAALCVDIALAVMNGFQISYGTGLHTSDLPLNPQESLIPTLKYWYAYQIVYPLTLLFVKASILALYWRIFAHTTLHRVWIIAAAAIVGCYTVVVMFVNAFECHSNVSQAWSITFPEGCNDLPAAYYSMAGINIATDLMILVLPIHPLTKLNINRRKRYALVAIFLVGSIAVLASCIRLYSLWVYSTSDDVPYDAIFILLWSQIEINVAIVCASVPPLRPLFSKAFGSSMSYGPPGYNGRGYRSPYGNDLSGGRIGLSRSQRRSGVLELYAMSKSGDSNVKTSVTAATRAIDNDSEELILQDMAGNRITRTVETRVSSEAMEISDIEFGQPHAK